MMKIKDEAVVAAAEAIKNGRPFRHAETARAALTAALPHMGGVKIDVGELAEILSDNGVVIDGRISVLNIASEIEASVNSAALTEVLASHEPATEPAKDGPEVVAYMHPTAKWAHHRVTEVLPHCKTDGSDGGPQPLVRQSALTACQQEVERLTQENALSLDRRRQLQARISRLQTSAETAEARNAELVKALDQLLDDMGENGLCVCQAAKDQAIAALGGQSNEA